MSATVSRVASRCGALALLCLLCACSILPRASAPHLIVLAPDDTLYQDLGDWELLPERAWHKTALRWLAGDEDLAIRPLDDLRPRGAALWSASAAGVFRMDSLEARGEPRPFDRRRARGLAPLADGRLWLSLDEPARVEQRSPTGNLLQRIEPPQGWNQPGRLVADERRLWVLDPGASCLQLFDAEGTWLKRISGPPDLPMLAPLDACGDGEGGLWLLDAWRGGLYHFSAEGELLPGISLRTQGPGALSLAHSLARDTRGHLLVLCLDELRLYTDKGALVARIQDRRMLGDPILVRCDTRDRMFLPQRDGGLRIFGFRPLHGAAAWEVQP